MKVAEIPSNEKERLEALREYSILDSLPERDFDDITKLASEICNVPISLITLLDNNRQWFKSSFGFDEKETSRDIAFCAHAINQPNELMVVPDSKKDDRFYDNPLVTGGPNIGFYAGMPLTDGNGFALGTLCVLDNKPRELDQHQSDSLKALANLVVKLLNLRKANLYLAESESKQKQANEELEKFAYVVSHDLKSPVNQIMAITKMLQAEYVEKIDASGMEMIGYLYSASSRLRNLIDGILAYSRGDKIASERKEKIEFGSFLKGVISLVDAKKEFKFNYPQHDMMMVVNKVALEQILINLLTNSIKYNDKPQSIVDISYSENEDFYTLSIKDNGIGIEEKNLSKIFDVFVNLGKRDRYDNVGTGIGLSTVKKLVERLGGNLTVTSEVTKGSMFTFTIKK